MLPALTATWLPNHDNGGMQQGFFHNPPFSKGGLGGFESYFLRNLLPSFGGMGGGIA